MDDSTEVRTRLTVAFPSLFPSSFLTTEEIDGTARIMETGRPFSLFLFFLSFSLDDLRLEALLAASNRA